MTFLGHPGRMIELKCPTAQQVAAAERYTFATTLGGAVKAQVGPPARRTWDLQLGQLTTPAEVGVLMDFANGVWGPGPFWFLPTDALVVNMLTPAAAACDRAEIALRGGGRVTGYGPMNLGDDGFAASSVQKTHDGTLVFHQRVPVIPGRPVTGSAWVQGIGHIRLEFRDTAGGLVHAREAFHGQGTPGRVSVTGTVPDESATVELCFTPGLTQITRPAITLTDQAYEWGDGQGCRKAIVHNTVRDVVKAWHDPTTGRWSQLSFTVQEVG